MKTQDVTLSLPEDLVRRAQHVAVERGVSLSALVGSYLEGLEEGGGPEPTYEQAQECALARMRQGLPMGVGEQPTWTRDELHER